MPGDEFDMALREPSQIVDASDIRGRSAKARDDRAQRRSSAHTQTRREPRSGVKIETVALAAGTVSRLRCAPHTALSLPADLAAASTQSLYALHVLTGEVGVEQAGRRSLARTGDIVVFGGALPTRIATGSQSSHDFVTLAMPAERLQNLEGSFGSLRLLRERTATPLTGCLALVADHMSTASKAQLDVLYEACAALLAATVSRLEQLDAPHLALSPDNPLLRDILHYTNRNLVDGGLRPPRVAEKFGISIRYLHKLFAASGVTFGSYVAMRRLDHVRSELMSGAGTPESIAALAFKWGFQDISTFNKAFRKRFGCAPRRFRSRSGC